MPILAGSRYEGANLIVIAEDERTRVLIEDRDPIKLEDVGSDPIRHTVQEGDEIDILAFRFGGKHRLWWIIADLNDLDFPYELTPGEVLTIPPRDFFERF